ncbi:MAG: diacylglycerol kinase family lipid kinase [Phototrophicaceae bacterium]
MLPSDYNVHFIINPVSGNSDAPFASIGRFMGEAECKTTMHVTKVTHSASDCVATALVDSPDLIVAYGGDGTVMEVATCLHDHDIPLAVLAGGTANVIAHELNIPVQIDQALDLIFNQEHEFLTLDAGKVNESHFLLRLCLGWEAELSLRPTTEAKSTWGPLAYTQAALEALNDTDTVSYELTFADGSTETVTGINCSVCNIGNVGLYGVNIGAGISPSDGLLNVLILQSNSLQAMADITQNLLSSALPLEIEERLPHYKAKKVTIYPSSDQRMSIDGEAFESPFPMSVECVQDYATFLIPKQV